jgi:hypothetical protein
MEIVYARERYDLEEKACFKFILYRNGTASIFWSTEKNGGSGGNRTRTRTNTDPNDTESNAAGRRGVRMCSANGTCENQGAWVTKSLTKSEAHVGGAHFGNA